MTKKIYLDYAATTPVRTEVLAVMNPYFDKQFGNASSIHKWGRDAKEALDQSRATIAKALGCKEGEIIFTSGGTEADNLAIIGATFASRNLGLLLHSRTSGSACANREKGKHIITSTIEHPAVLDTCKWLAKNGFDVTYVPVDKYGIINPKDVERAIRKDTVLVSIMHANNEIGTIQPIEAIGKICRAHGVLFHTDAVQTFCHVPIDLTNIDLLSVSSHKIGGPKGVGALFVRTGVRLEPLVHGGGQEHGMRSGTENVAGIVGFAKAIELGMKEMNKEAKRLAGLRDILISGVLKIENSALTGHPTARLPNNASFWFKFIEGEALGLSLDDLGIASSTGSACSSKSLEPSHVLLACGLKAHEAHGSLRLTIGRDTTRADVDYVLKVLPNVVEKLRKISPFKTRYA